MVKFGLKDWQRLSGEAYGTFMFCLLYALAITLAPGNGRQLSIGLGLVVLTFTTGPVSGGMMNPAITFAMMLTKKLTHVEGLYCIAIQMAAGLLAGALALFLFYYNVGTSGYPFTAKGTSQGEAFWAEMIQTFALVLVYLNVYATKANIHNDRKAIFGLAIGFTYLAGSIVLGQLSGGCQNPAVSMLTVVHGHWGDMFVYIFAPLFGAFFASVAYSVLNPTECEADCKFLKIFGLSNDPANDEKTRLVSIFFMEFLGTFYLVWTVCLSPYSLVGPYGAIAIGGILMSFIYAGGYISGAHYNPCVTLGVYLRGMDEKPQLISQKMGMCYVACQLAGAFLAAFFAAGVVGGVSKIAQPGGGVGFTAFSEFIVETLFAGMLVTAVLSSATYSKSAGNTYYGMAIGWAVISGALSVGAISGGVFNPAIGIALPLITGQHVQMIELYMFANFFGAVLAAYQFKFWLSDVPEDELGNPQEALRDGSPGPPDAEAAEESPNNPLHKKGRSHGASDEL